MDETKIRNLMIPLDEYATVDQDANLYDIVKALKKAQSSLEQDKHKHRAVLVIGAKAKVVGKISQIDILRGLEPGYKKIGQGRFAHYGISREDIKTMMQGYQLWSGPLDALCENATAVKARDIMHSPAEGEYLDAGATLGQALHQLVVCHEQSLLVTQEDAVIGILRLTDVFATIAQALENCE